MTEHVDLTALLGVANAAEELPPTVRSTALVSSRPHIRLGVARDAAFCFYYHDNFHRLAMAGADLIFFSPLVEAHLPEHLDALWIGGGYPELHAEALAANVSMREDIRRFAETGYPIYAECGGLMYLCETLYDATAVTHPMVGVFPFQTRMTPRRRALGYREITVASGNPFFPAGLRLRGHEFHYSEMVEGVPNATHVRRTLTVQDSHHSPCDEGFTIKRTLGTYTHVHLVLCPRGCEGRSGK